MARLVDFLQNPFDLGIFWGTHLCEICLPQRPIPKPDASREELASYLSADSDGFLGIAVGQTNLFIPTPDSLPFQEALMQCPEMNSPRYLAELRLRGLSNSV